MELFQELAVSLQEGNSDSVARLTSRAIETDVPAKEILDQGLIAGMSMIGEKFRKHEIFLPDVLLAAKAMHVGMEMLKPLLIRDGIPSIGKVVIGTVQGDLHDIGKNLVGIMLRGAGFEVIDLGSDVTPEAFIETAERENAGVIGLSALLTTTMPMMARVVELARERGIYGRTKIIVGGAPLSGEFAEKIGAHAYGYDGGNAVVRVKQFLEVA